jgi:glycosyltransferase involved in cell wall biosynthesis
MGVLLAARHAGAAVVMMNESHRHTSQAGGVKLRLKRALVRLFHAGLIGGQPQKEYFEELGIPPECLFDGYDAVDNRFFEHAAGECRMRAQELRQKYALPESYFLSIGRMEEKKNLFLLLRAYAHGCASDPGMPRLVFVGSGALERQLRDECVELGLSFADLRSRPKQEGMRPVEADVYFYGFRQASELPVFYSLATTFILPSKREEWGLVVNEAMACGLPVIVSKVAGCARDLVQEGRNGFLFDPSNEQELIKHLRWIGENREAAEKMGEYSRHVIANWDVTRFAENAEKAADAACAMRARQSA